MKIIKKVLLAIGLFFIGILLVSAEDYQTEDVNVSCDDLENCVVSNDNFSLKIKEIDLVDSKQSKLEKIESWHINPKLYYGEYGSQKFRLLNLDLTFSNLKELVLKHKDSTFEGKINISYEFELKNPLKYNYKLESVEELVSFLVGDSKSLISGFPVTGSFNYFEVKIDEADNLTTTYEYTYTDGDGGHVTGTDALLFIGSDDEVKNITESSNVNEFYVANLTPAEFEDVDVNDYIDDNSSEGSDSPTVVDTQDTQEKSKTTNPKTSVISYITITILAIVAYMIYFLANKKILKRKI